jgi:hypothetical protein
MAVFVLGAGATRGASFVNPCKNLWLPPPDADFFTQLQRVQNPKHKELIAQVIVDTVDLFGVNFSAALETTFTTLEHTIRMVSTTKETWDFNKEDLQGKHDRLLQALAAVMEEALTERSDSGGGSHRMRSCSHHERLVAHLLDPSDEIICFNYDCLIDHALREHGNGKWHARYGYGLPLGAHGSRLSGDKHWSAKEPASKDSTVHLYKLRGSLHFWVQKNDKIQLKERPYTKQHGNLRFTIIPPESHKAYDQEPFKGVWRKAGAAINKARGLIFIGYSLPPTDLHSTALLRTSVKKESLRSLVIVNPDREARKRTRDVVRRGLSEKTHVLVFDELKEFVAAKRSLRETP